MSNQHKIQTEIAKKDKLTLNQISFINKLINQVYMLSESDFWPHDGSYTRTTLQEVINFVKNNELIIAKLTDEIVGAVHICDLKNDICGFGMLVSSPNYRNTGIGSSLMKAVENWAKENNYKTIQLELLKPSNYLHTDKEFLKNWYCNLGYKLINSVSYKDLYPEQSHLLKIPCTFDIYQKTL